MLAAAGTTVSTWVPEVRLVAAAVIFGVPARLSRYRNEPVLAPAPMVTVVTVAVPPVFTKAAVPSDEVDRLTVVEPVVTGLPFASWRCTVIVGEAALFVVVAVTLTGDVVMTSFEAPAAPTVNVIVPFARGSPLVTDAVSVTDSAFEYVKPVSVTELVPAEIVPVRGPVRIPVPVVKARLKLVSAATVLALPETSCAWTTTLNAAPAVGLVGLADPPSVVALPPVIVKPLLVALVSVPLVA